MNLIAKQNKRNISFGDRLCRFALESLGVFEFKTAETFEHLLSAFGLVYQEYVSRGYCQPKRSKIYYTYFCLLPESRTFLMTEKKTNQVLETVSLVIDSAAGLPMELLFGHELSRLRNPNKRIAEVTLLAASEKSSMGDVFSAANASRLLSVFNLFRYLFQYALNSGVTDLVIAVNPKHEAIYRYLTFEPIGDICSYPAACGHPARPMHLDLVRFCHPQLRHQTVQQFFLSDSDAYGFNAKPAHWNLETVEKLILAFQPPEPEWRLVLEPYLKSYLSFK